MSIRPSPELLRTAAVACLVACCAAATAADALDLRADRERQRASNERRRIEAEYGARVRQCETQFVVTSCIEEAKAQRREALDRLTQQQAVIEDALRKQRAAERLERLQEKQQQAAERRNAPTVPPRVVHRASRAASAASAAASAPASSSSPAIRLPESHLPSPAEQRRNEAAYQQRQKAAAEHKALVERRNAERAAAHKPAASLPLPAASAASR